jgi:hypothetical protein
MNKSKNPIVRVFDYLIDTITELFVSLFDGLLRGVDHATPSTFALDASLLPWALPLPIAFMTAHSLEEFFGWERWASITMGLGLEGLGILVWARLANAFVEKRVSNAALYLLSGVAFVYEAILVVLNVILAIQHGVDGWYAAVLFLVCLLPALSAILYGFHKHDVINKLAVEEAEKKALAERERIEQKELEEKIRQERRADALERARMKALASDTKEVKLKDKSFRGDRKS